MGRFLKFIVFGLSISFIPFRLSAQSITVSATDPRHETQDQRSIEVLFSGIVSGTSLNGDWVVKIGAITVPTTSVTLAVPINTKATIVFDATVVNGIGVNYLLPGQTLTVQFTNTGSTLKVGGVTCANSAGFITSKNNWAGDCSDVLFYQQGTFGPPVNVCVPVIANFTQFQFYLSLRGRNSTLWVPAGSFFNVINWGDGSPNDNQPAYQSDNLGAASSTFINSTGLSGFPAVVMTTRPTYTYPSTTTPPGPPTQCGWSATITPALNFAAFTACIGITQTKLFANYDTDNKNTGALSLLPSPLPTSRLVCRGTNVGMRFSDNTTLNCLLAVENRVPNQLKRNIRIIYGSQNFGAPGNIPDIFVTLPAVLGGATVRVTNNDATGTLTFPLGFFPSSVVSADGNGVITLPAAVTVSTLLTYMGTIFTIDPTKQIVGQRFYVKLEYWDVCNAYNPLSPPTLLLAESIENYVEIVAKPLPLTTTGQAICYTSPNSTAFNFTASSSVGLRTGVNWYKDVASVGTATMMTNSNPPVGNSLIFPAASYGAQGGIGGNFTSNNTNGRYHSVWATQVASGSNSCESDPVEIVIIQQPRIDIGTDIPTTPSGNNVVCNGPPGVLELYTTSAPNTKAIPVTTSTNAAAVNLSTENIWNVSGFVPSVTFTPATGNSTTVTYNISPQPAPINNGSVSVRRGYVTSATIPVVSPLPPPFALPTYTITPLACLSNNVNLSVDVFGKSNGGTISPSPTICEGVTTGNMNATGTLGAILRWERSFNAGAFASIAGTAGSLAFSEVPPSGAGTYMYRVVVQNQNAGGPCSAATTIVANQNTVKVNPVPPQPTISQAAGSTGLTICADGVQLTRLQSSDVGTLAASYQWFRNGSPIGGATSSIITLNTVATSGSYTVQVIGVAPSNCPSLISNPTIVTINPLPTAANPTGGGAVCSGNPAPDIVWSGLTGTAPFTVSYSITKNPGAIVTPVGPIAEPTTTFTIVAPNPVGGIPGDTFDYKITSLVDANGCSATNASLLALSSRQVSIGGTAPAFDTAPTLTPVSVCDNGASTTDPQLNFSLDVPSTAAGNYTLTYKIDALANQTQTFTVNLGNGDPSAAITFTEVALNTVAAHIVRVVSILTPSGCLTTFNINLPFTVNPLPANPTGAVNGIVCSTSATGATLSVNDPGAGFVIEWYTNAVGTIAATGTTSGIRNQSFAPTSNLTATYFALSRNIGTLCRSAFTLGVTNTLDTAPATAAGGPNQSLCATSVIMAATPANNGGSGVWTKVSGPGAQTITAPSSAATSITGLVQNAPGGAANVYVFRWTVGSAQFPAAGSCPQTISDVIVTVNTIPALTGIARSVCEAVAGGGSTSGINLTLEDVNVTTHPLGAPTVAWFTNAARTTPVATPASVTVIAPTTTFYFIATSSTGCINNTGQLTYTVNPQPSVATPSAASRQFCEDVLGGNQKAGIDLPATFDNVITGGALNRSVAWFDATMTLIPTPTSYTLVGPITLFATVTNTITPPFCNRTVQVDLSIKPRPIGNPISGNASVCTGNNIILYQLDPSFNPGSTYTWSIVGTPPAAVQVFGGGGTNTANFFVLLKFPAAIGTVQIDVFETLNGCTGITNNLSVTVNSAPAPNTIIGLTQVCTNQTGVTYSVTPFAGNATSTYSWLVGAGASNTGPLTINSSAINVDFGTITPVTIQVTETATSGCVGTPATTIVNVNPRPVMTSSNAATVCSGSSPALNFTSAGSTFNWAVTGITGAIGGSLVGDLGTGNISQVLVNNSGVVGSVTYSVTPTASAAPFCVGPSQSVTITVNPAPVLVNPQTKTICSGKQVNYEILTTPANLPASNIFNWSAPTMSNASIQGSPGVNVSAGAAGTLHITDILVNTSASPITATYTITPTSGAGCPGTPRTVVITLAPEPVMTSASAETICSGTTPTLGFTSTVASNYAWSITTITGTLTGASVGQTGSGNLSLQFTGPAVIKNTSISSAIVKFKVVPTSSTGSGCVGAPQFVDLTIDAEPLMTSAPTVTICSGQTPALSFTSTITANYNWTVTSILGTVTGVINGQVGTMDLSNTFFGASAIKNVSGASATVVFSVVPVSTFGTCSGAPPQTVTMTVNPEPVMTSPNNNTICSGATPTLVFSANVASTFGWAVTGIAGTVSGVTIGQTGSGDLSATFTGASSIVNTSGAAASVTFSVIPTASTGTGCTGASQIVTLNINPQPQMTSSNVNAFCSGGTPLLNFTSDFASNYNWIVANILGTLSGVVVGQSGAGNLSLTFTGGTAIKNTTVSPGNVTFNVTPTSTTGTGCVGSPQVVTLTVNPEPVMTSPTNPLPFCSRSAPPLTFTSSVPSTFSWVVTGITGTLSNVINGQPGSGNLSSTFAGLNAIINTSGALGTVSFSVTPTSTSGLCVGAAQSVTISINPEPVMTSAPSTATCSGQTPTLIFTSNLASTFGWQVSSIVGTVTGVTVLQSGSGDLSSTFAGGAAIKNTSISVATVQFLVTPTSATGSGCSGAVQLVTLTVNPEPVMSSTTTPSVCSGQSPGFTFTSSIAATYSWSVTNITGTLSGVSLLQSGTGDLSSTFTGAAAIRNISLSPGIVTFTVIPSAGGCPGAPQVVSLTVNPEPTGSDFTQPGCVNGTPLGHSIQSQVSNVASLFTYTVSSGNNIAVPPGPDRTVASNALINDTYTNTSGAAVTITYTITPFSSASNCTGAPFLYKVNVSPLPVGSGAPGPADVCSRASININPQAFITNGVISVFSWSAVYDIGLTGGTGSGTGNITDVLTNVTGGVLKATYTVTPSAGGCTGALFVIVQNVNPEPVMTSTLANPFTICSTNAVSTNATGVALSVSNAVPTTYNIVLKSIDSGLTSLIGNAALPASGVVAGYIASDKFRNTTSAQMKVVYTVTPVATLGGCLGVPIDITVQVNPEPVLFSSGVPQVCSTNSTNPPNPINVLLSTNGTSASAASYKLISLVQYSNGGPFSTILPTGFTIVSATALNASGNFQLIQSDRYKNTSATPVTVRYTIQATSAASCLSMSLDYDVIINPEPILAPGAFSACSGDPFGVASATLGPIGTSAPITQYFLKSTVVQGSPTIALTPASTNAALGTLYASNTFIASDVWTNVNATFFVVRYTIVPYAGSCPGADQFVDVTINPAPALKSGLDQIVCNTAITNIVLQDNSPTSAPATSYNIISTSVVVNISNPALDVAIAPGATVLGLTADAANAITGITALVNRLKNDKFTNTTNNRITVRYQVVPISSANCKGPQAAITVVIEPSPLSTSTNLTLNICSGTPLDIRFGTPTYSNGLPTNPVITYSYATSPSSIIGISGNTVGNNLLKSTTTPDIQDVLINSTNNPITVHYKVTPLAAAAANGIGCTTLPAEDVAVIVQPRPKVNPLSNKTICEGDPINLTLVSPTTPATGTIKFFVTAVATSGISGVTSNNVFIANNAPLGDILTISRPLSNVPQSVTYTIEPRNVDAVTNAIICSDASAAITVVVTVSPKPVVTPVSNFSICSGEAFNPITIPVDTDIADPGSTIVSWTVVPNASVSGESNGSGNAFSQVLFNTTTDKVVVQYLLKAKYVGSFPSCSGTDIPLNVTVYPNPKLVGLPSSQNVCNNGTLSSNPYPLNSSTVPALGTVFDWIVDNGANPDLPVIPVSSGTSINQTFINNGTSLGTYQYAIMPRLAIPLIEIIPIGANRVCPGQDGIMLVNVAPAVSGVMYGNDINGNQTQTLYICKGSKDFLYIDPVGLPLIEVKYKEGSVVKTLSRLGGLTSISIAPTTTTVYELISVKDQYNCVKPITNQIVTAIVDEVDNSFSLSSATPSPQCDPYKALFVHNQVSGTSYTWKWLDGPDSTTYLAGSSVAGKIIRHTFRNPSPSSPTPFRVSLDAFLDTLKYQNGCRKKAVVVPISVYPNIFPQIFVDKDSICSGETVKFTNTSQGVTSHRWTTTESSAVATDKNPSFTFTNRGPQNPKKITVFYNSNNVNCPAKQQLTQDIWVYQGVTADFANGPVPDWNGSSTVSFTNNSVPVNNSQFSYNWTFGLAGDATPTTQNTFNPNPVDVTYASAGSKDILLRVTNLVAKADGLTCEAQKAKSIFILLPPLAADFEVDPALTCFPTMIKIKNILAIGPDGAGLKYEWILLNGTDIELKSNLRNPERFSVSKPGVYTITFTVTSPSTGQSAIAGPKNFTVYDKPIASFETRPSIVFVPDTEMTAFNFSKRATSYSWDFGDGGTSTESDPKYTYQVEGKYDVTLIAKDDHGNGVICADTTVRQVIAKQGGQAKIPNAFTPNVNGPSPDGRGANGTFNDVFLPLVKGVPNDSDAFNLQIYDRWGNLIFESTSSTRGWDGYNKDGKLMPAGVYVYKLTLRFSDSQRTTQVGDVTMIH